MHVACFESSMLSPHWVRLLLVILLGISAGRLAEGSERESASGFLCLELQRVVDRLVFIILP